MSRITSKLANGRLKVNKAQVIEKLRKSLAKTREAKALGTIPVGPREIEATYIEMTRNNAEKFLNHEDI